MTYESAARLKVGTKVCYSPHYKKTHGYTAKARFGRIGTVQRVGTYEEDGNDVHYPEVLWNDGVTSVCHPFNVSRLSKKVLTFTP